MAVIHRRPVCVDKIIDVVVGEPAVAHYDRTFFYVFFNKRRKVRHASSLSTITLNNITVISRSDRLNNFGQDQETFCFSSFYKNLCTTIFYVFSQLTKVVLLKLL